MEAYPDLVERLLLTFPVMSVTKEDLRQSKFYLEVEPDVVYQGFTTGERWNGFACPYFELNMAKEIAVQFARIHEDDAHSWDAEYDPEEDIFRFYDPAYSEPEEFGPVEVGGGEKLYPIGAFSWTWREKATADAS